MYNILIIDCTTYRTCRQFIRFIIITIPNMTVTHHYIFETTCNSLSTFIKLFLLYSLCASHLISLSYPRWKSPWGMNEPDLKILNIRKYYGMMTSQRLRRTAMRLLLRSVPHARDILFMRRWTPLFTLAPAFWSYEWTRDVTLMLAWFNRMAFTEEIMLLIARIGYCVHDCNCRVGCIMCVEKNGYFTLDWAWMNLYV